MLFSAHRVYLRALYWSLTHLLLPVSSRLMPDLLLLLFSLPSESQDFPTQREKMSYFSWPENAQDIWRRKKKEFYLTLGQNPSKTHKAGTVPEKKTLKEWGPEFIAISKIYSSL